MPDNFFVPRQPAFYMRHTNNFDLLRLIAATTVLFSHCYALTGHTGNEPFAAFTDLDTGGGLAVTVFFAISGYLITGSCLNSNGAADYLIKRALRLIPGLAICVMATIFIMGIFFSTLPAWEYLSSPVTAAYWHNMWLYVHYYLPGVFERNAYPGAVNGSLWTLPIEALMYLIVLFLGMARALNTRAMVIFLGMCWLAYFRGIPAFALQNAAWAGVFPVAESAKLLCIFFGGALLYLHDKHGLTRTDLAILALFALLAVRGANAVLAAYIMLSPLIVLALSFLPLGPASRLCKNGDISYGVYIYAFPIQQSVVSLLGNDVPPLTLFWYSLPVTCLLALLSWMFVEKPSLALKKHPMVLTLEQAIRRLSPIPRLLPGKQATR